MLLGFIYTHQGLSNICNQYSLPVKMKLAGVNVLFTVLKYNFHVLYLNIKIFSHYIYLTKLVISYFAD